jgi:uroporphyrin-III C-methyltransferase/precorrin-2 dehydrogenase/sirohydrochlorin ferrochelatase|eukprot:COSAG06_NODE_40371_length_402_cov_1.207921_1_plen_93_part_00
MQAMRNLDQLVARMLELGFPADTPAAVVQSATVKEQKALRTTIGAMEADVEQHGLKSPAVITVGGVAKALDGSLGWDEYLAQFPPIVKEAQG